MESARGKSCNSLKPKALKCQKSTDKTIPPPQGWLFFEFMAELIETSVSSVPLIHFPAAAVNKQALIKPLHTRQTS